MQPRKGDRPQPRVQVPLAGFVGWAPPTFPGRIVALRKVGVGRDFGSYVEVLDGVSAADRVIVNPPDSLVEGAEVRPLKVLADVK